MQLHDQPFSVPLYYTPAVLKGPAQEVYLAVKRDALRSGEVGFADQPLPGQLIHSAFVVGSGGLKEFGLSEGALLIADVWPNAASVEAAIQDYIGPALGVAGLPDPEQVSDLELIGCIGNPDIGDFQAGTAVANMLVWPDLGVDPIQLYNAAFARIIGDEQPLVTGSGTHVAYRIGNQIVTCEIWRSEADQQRGMHDRIMPGVGAVFDDFGVKGDPHIAAARPLGIAVRQEIRYPITG